MQADQIKGMLDRALGILAVWLLTQGANRGWITQSDVAQLLPALVLLPSIAWGWWINRDKALLQSAATVPGTVVVTTPALAQETPNEANIVSTAAPKAAISAAVDSAKITPKTT